MSENNTDNIIRVDIEQEVKQSYLTYAMSVIVSRALPDARDGLKPVHRRILYSMLELGLRHNTPTKKCSRILGAVLANYHPHGPISVYNALARLAQDFSVRYPLVHGQGNFGSIDGDPPAAFRYTEAKLSAIAEEMMADIKKNTVDFILNYDESQKEPSVLPATLPALLVNGAMGIAVGFTTEIPPHNLNEVADGIVALIDNPGLTNDELFKIIKGPDFPLGGIIKGKSGIFQAYKTGSGRITIQSHHVIEQTKDSEQIVFTDIPYTKRKAEIIQGLAEQVNNEAIIDVRDIRDESNKEGIRVVIELKRDAHTALVLQRIYNLSDFQANYSIHNIALVDGKPQALSLMQMLHIYIEHRKQAVFRKTKFELEEAHTKAHLLRGLLVALHNIDEVVQLIKASDTPKIAKERLMDTLSLDDVQAEAILDMRLQRLTSLEIKKVENDLADLEKLIIQLQEILDTPQMILNIIKENIQTLAKKHGNERRTEIQESEALSISEEELINKEEIVLTLSASGYIKRTLLSEFSIQKRGGKGKFGISLGKDDVLRNVYVGNTHSPTLFITSQGRAFIIKLYQIPVGSRTSRGQSVNSIFNLQSGEYISSILHAPLFDKEFENAFIVLASKQGKIKKIVWNELTGALTKRGIKIMNLKDTDEVVGGIVSNSLQDIFLFANNGRVLRFSSTLLRATGRTAAGVGGMKLSKTATLANIGVGNKDSAFMLLTQNGYGKRMRAADINPHGRNTSGVVCIKITDKTSSLVTALSVQKNDVVTAMTIKGKTLRVNSDTCPLQGRTAQGVSVFKVTEDAVSNAIIYNEKQDASDLT